MLHYIKHCSFYRQKNLNFYGHKTKWKCAINKVRRRKAWRQRKKEMARSSLRTLFDAAVLSCWLSRNDDMNGEPEETGEEARVWCAFRILPKESSNDTRQRNLRLFECIDWMPMLSSLQPAGKCLDYTHNIGVGEVAAYSRRSRIFHRLEDPLERFLSSLGGKWFLNGS